MSPTSLDTAAASSLFGAAAAASHDSACSICRDECIRARVVQIHGLDATVRTADGRECIAAIDFVPGVRVGDELVVRLGVALGHVATEAAP